MKRWQHHADPANEDYMKEPMNTRAKWRVNPNPRIEQRDTKQRDNEYSPTNNRKTKPMYPGSPIHQYDRNEFSDNPETVSDNATNETRGDCKHNAMVLNNLSTDFAWKCADCGHIYGLPEGTTPENLKYNE